MRQLWLGGGCSVDLLRGGVFPKANSKGGTAYKQVFYTERRCLLGATLEIRRCQAFCGYLYCGEVAVTTLPWG